MGMFILIWAVDVTEDARQQQQAAAGLEQAMHGHGLAIFLRVV